jgi:hypothetical protein
VTTSGAEQLSVDRRGSASSSATIADVDIATIVLGRGLNENSGAFKGAVTVERRSADDTIWVRSWQIDAGGTTVTLVDTEQVKDIVSGVGLTGTDVDVTVTGLLGNREIIMVSAATSAGLRVQSWAITSAGQLSRVDQINAENAETVSGLSSAKVGFQDALVAGRTASGGLTLISFHTTSQGRLGRVGTRDAGGITAVAVDGRTSFNDVVVLPTDTMQELSLLHYRTNYSWAN